MVFTLHRRLRDKIWPEPLPSPASFEGQTVLVTGATTGIGMASAIHFARLGAKVIITSRTQSKGQVAKNQIEQDAGIVGERRVHVMELDMSRYSSCVSFVDRLKQNEMCNAGLDVAILNAGLIHVEHVLSPEGWEQTIQVNTLSTVLLGLLLLHWMKEKHRVDSKKPHLVFVTSRDHMDPEITSWIDFADHEGILRHFSDNRNWLSGKLDPNYAESKLMLTYAVEHICERARAPDGSVDVIVNSVCPGLVCSELGRSISSTSIFMRLSVPIYLGVLGKSADYGARFYITAARTMEYEHGKYIQSLFSQGEYRELATPTMTSDAALKVKTIVWDEIINELETKVPVLKGM
ncbi:putative short chain dehydrogenase/ reductase [Phaeosphaeriaceae sp. PMI808]|nr:putative short chain dehydrogenase/ reductase [Phaeosphaeriaceae sp. PMI808]